MIRANLEFVRELAPGCALTLAVKANAYGHGAVAVSRMVQRTGVAERVAVATIDEALELRRAGITLPVMKLSPALPHELATALDAGLVLPVGTTDEVDALAAAARGRGRPALVHLKVDTGMGRLGCRPEEALDLAARIDAAPNLELEGLFTHLPVSDAADDDGFTERELDLFTSIARELESRRGPIPHVHAANSGAILAHPRAGLTMVRPGIMAYGYVPDAANPALDPTGRLRPALTWRARVSLVKRVGAGTPIGYGSTWTADRDTWIATVSAGYADGFSRLFSNRGRVLLGGRPVPVVGRVCMDQFMVDLGPDAPQVAIGDHAVLIGRDGDHGLTADDLASLMGTISYEVLCLIGARVPRTHVES